MKPRDDINQSNLPVFENEDGGAIVWLIVAVLCILAAAIGAAAVALWEFFT